MEEKAIVRSAPDGSDNHNIILKPPYHMVGQVGEGCLFITSPVRTSYLRVPINIRNSKIRVKTVLKL